MLPALLPPLALKLSPVGRFLKSIPPKVWIAIAVVALIGAGGLWHNRAVGKAHDAGYSEGKAAEGARIAAKALTIKRGVDALTGKITATIRSMNNAANNSTGRDADTVRLHGPGKAACAGLASVPAGAGRYIPPVGQASPAVDQVPSAERIDLIGLPFAGAVTLAENHDLCRNDLIAYREWGKQIGEAWAKVGK